VIPLALLSFAIGLPLEADYDLLVVLLLLDFEDAYSTHGVTSGVHL
jgi:hypothetical protein